MGAEEILKILEKGKHLTSNEIAEQCEASVNSVKKAIKRLLKDVSEDVEFRPLTQDEKVEKFGRKIGAKIHIYWIGEE